MKVTAGFALALALLAVIDAVSYRSITTLAATVQQITRSHGVLDALYGVLAQIKNAETGQRGYLLTGDERYLEPYRTAIRDLREEIERLRGATYGNAVQLERVERLDLLVDQKLSELSKTITLRRSQGFEAAVEVVRTDQGKAIMDRIRALVSTIEAEEWSRLRAWDEVRRERVRFTFYIIGTGSLLGLLLFGIATYVIRLDIMKREEAERALQQANENLDARIRERTAELTRANEGLAREMAARERAQVRLMESSAEIARSRDDMQGILNRLQLGTAVINDAGRVEFVNADAQRLLGRSSEAMLGRPWQESFPLDQGDQAQFRAALAAGGSRRPRLSVHLENSGGHHYWVHIDVQDDPRDPRHRIVCLYDVTELYALRRQLGEQAHFHDLVGKSSAMRRVYQMIGEVAKVDATVLIEGATGTGKELVAQAIHRSSPRKDHSFIAVNSAGLTEALLASQLFGHRRGAFTSAVADQQGFFEAANGGTLFLDEIGDVPPSVQAGLLRVLQEKEFTRLGESRPRSVDVRVLAATQHDLPREVERGKFRADLLYRLRVARLVLPSLRERREDIPLLVETFVAQARAASGKEIHHVSHEAMRLLLDYGWPGNVRELKSAIEFASIRSDGPVIHAADLPPEISAAWGRTNWNAEDERDRILAALRGTGGNRSEAARRLGMSRSTFYRHLSCLDLPESSGGTTPVSDDTVP
ncbi:MAG: sigma 54-interacting transcriptional regulator [Gemmatimonadales bacterium]